MRYIETITEEQRQRYNARKRANYALDRERHIEKAVAWNKANPEKVATNMRKCRELRPEYYYEYNKEWRLRNKESVRLHDKKKHAKRRAAINSSPEKITRAQWELIKSKQGYRCFYCSKKPDKLTKDHIVPLSKGGNHSAQNIIAACNSCNTRKMTSSIYEFAQRRGRLLF